jgi:hypothetical protein
LCARFPSSRIYSIGRQTHGIGCCRSSGGGSLIRIRLRIKMRLKMNVNYSKDYCMLLYAIISHIPLPWHGSKHGTSQSILWPGRQLHFHDGTKAQGLQCTITR